MKKFFVLISMILFLGHVLFAGTEWVSFIKIDSKKKKQSNAMDMHTYAQNGNVKQVFKGVERENHFYSQEGYWLFKAADANIYVVDSAKRTYMVLALDQLLQMTGMLGSLVKITIKEHKIDTQVLPDEKILGYNCTHLKIDTKYTMKIKIAFIKKTLRIHEIKEIWGSPDVPGLDQMHKSFLEKDFSTGIEDLDEMIRQQLKQQKKVGFPLKTITHNMHLSKKGKVKMETTTTMTVKKIEKKDFPKTFFEIPADYEHIEMPGAKGKMF
ncbi:MAG: DUF4412 domain-containing protein [bacterium]|nr:DUF4412 domain-containing protein [bacterium]